MDGAPTRGTKPSDATHICGRRGPTLPDLATHHALVCSVMQPCRRSGVRKKKVEKDRKKGEKERKSSEKVRKRR